MHGTHVISKKMYQIIALRDIPSKGVKIGDEGGYVSDGKVLSHLGDCWISKGSKAYGDVTVRGDAYLNKATLVACRSTDGKFRRKNRINIMLSGKAVVSNQSFVGRFSLGGTTIKGNAVVKNHVNLSDVSLVKDNAYLDGNIYISKGSHIIHNAKVTGKAVIGKYVKLCGTAVVSDFAEIMDEAIVESGTISGYTVIAKGAHVSRAILTKSKAEEILTPDTTPVAKTSDPSSSKDEDVILLEIIERKLFAYQHDIVKLIKFPIMNDVTDSHTLAMTVAHQKALRARDSENETVFHTLVETLEEKFLMAESNALKLSLSLFTPNEKRKIFKAQDLLDIVVNDASAPQEKKSAYKQIRHNLEGLIAIPPLAIKSLSERSGLLEIEM